MRQALPIAVSGEALLGEDDVGMLCGTVIADAVADIDDPLLWRCSPEHDVALACRADAVTPLGSIRIADRKPPRFGQLRMVAVHLYIVDAMQCEKAVDVEIEPIADDG